MERRSRSTANSTACDDVPSFELGETETSVERDEVLVSALSGRERRKLELSVRKRHHSPDHVLVRMLRWKGAKDSRACGPQDFFVAVLVKKLNHLLI